MMYKIKLCLDHQSSSHQPSRRYLVFNFKFIANFSFWGQLQVFTQLLPPSLCVTVIICNQLMKWSWINRVCCPVNLRHWDYDGSQLEKTVKGHANSQICPAECCSKTPDFQMCSLFEAQIFRSSTNPELPTKPIPEAQGALMFFARIHTHPAKIYLT